MSCRSIFLTLACLSLVFLGGGKCFADETVSVNSFEAMSLSEMLDCLNDWKTNAGRVGMIWDTGDFDGDTAVNLIDLNLWKAAMYSDSVGGSSVILASTSVCTSPVPEPGTLAMLVAGFAGLLVCVWRKRR